jgi:hydrogenase maturation factor
LAGPNRCIRGCGDQDGAQDECVQQGGGGEAESELGDHPFSPRTMARKTQIMMARGDDAAGRGLSDSHGAVVVAAADPFFVTTDEEAVVVHG